MNFVILGDSHSVCFREINKFQKKHTFDIISVSSASASGLSNLNSRYQQYWTYSQYLQNNQHKNYDYCLLQLGEVDCNVVFWNKDDYTLKEKMRRAIKSIDFFLKNVILNYFEENKIILLLPIFPIVKDEYIKQQPRIERRNIDVSYERRLKVTKKFNSLLIKTFKNSIDINNIIFDQKTNSVNLEYCISPSDPHLNSTTAAFLWYDKIKEIIC